MAKRMKASANSTQMITTSLPFTRGLVDPNPHGSIIAQIRAMRPGQSVTFTKELKKLPVGRAPGTYSQVLGGYALRGRPGCTWSYETFSAITSRGRVLIGCVMTLVQAERQWIAPHVAEPIVSSIGKRARLRRAVPGDIT